MRRRKRAPSRVVARSLRCLLFACPAVQRERDAAVAAAALREAELRALEEDAKKQAREFAKKTRATFGKSCRTAGLDGLHIDYLRASLTPDQLQPMVDAFAADDQSEVAKSIFATHLAALLAVEQAAADARAQVAAAAAAAKELRDLEANWTPEEHAMLAKAVAKHPHGTPLRWHKVAELVNSIAVRQRELADVVARALDLEAQQEARRRDDAQRYQSTTKTSGGESASPVASASPAASSSPPPAAASHSSAPSPVSPVVGSPVDPFAFGSSSGPFSLHEQQLFEFALRSIPKSDPARWEQIAGIVGTKTREQCEARFKLIVAHLKAEKQRRQ